ncbi:MAG: hypothetical protein EBZ74_08030 [Planctomycetia bacterium]|nr:hypothetical protein [Planctomycetia bacterium]
MTGALSDTVWLPVRLAVTLAQAPMALGAVPVLHEEPVVQLKLPGAVGSQVIWPRAGWPGARARPSAAAAKAKRPRRPEIERSIHRGAGRMVCFRSGRGGGAADDGR